MGQSSGEDINVEGVWNSGITGMGVNVAVVGEGMEFLHEDLAANVNTGLNYNYTENGDESGFSGTRVAGVIAAVGDNGMGVRGVAPRAGIYGYNLSGGLREADIIDASISDADVTEANVRDAMLRNREITAVSFNDWGGEDVPVLQGASAAWEEGVELGIREGFYGKGTFYVFGAGDGHENNDQGNFDEYSGYYAVTATCSVDRFGRKSSFSEEGVNLWVCAPGSDILTTGSNDGYVTVSGTSYSAAQVSGVAALMREVNGKLSWRDIKLILAASARQNDPSDPGWETRAVKYDPDTGYGFDTESDPDTGLGSDTEHDLDTGLGSDTEHDLDTRFGSDTEYKYNTKYGFGVVDAAAAVKLAENWRRVGPMKTLTAFSDNEIPLSDHDGEADGVITSTLTIQDTEELSFTEFVEVQLTFSHGYLPDLNIQLISPSGTVSQLVTEFSGETEGNGMEDVEFSYSGRTHRFGSAKHLGEHPAGEWILKISDTASSATGDTGTLHSWSIKVYGHKTDNAVTDSGSKAVPKAPPDFHGFVRDQVYKQWVPVNVTLLAAVGGDGTLRYSISPALPAGLSFDSNTRTISGTPTAAKSTTRYGYTVRDQNNRGVTIFFDITVNANSIPDFGNAEIEDQNYITGVQISPLVLPSATGGNGSRRYSLTPSSLPAGLTYNGITRRISGTPRVSLSETDYTWTVTDDDGNTDSITFSITVRSQSNIPSFGNKTVDDKVYITGDTVNLTLPEATGGTPPRTYNLSVSSIADGLSFNGNTRVISGTPTTPTPKTTYTYTVIDSDSDTDVADSDSLTFSITVKRALSFGDTVDDKVYTAGIAVTETLPSATGGNGTLTYSINPALPSGLSFDSNTREINGTPADAASNTDYTYTVTDGDGNTHSLKFGITIEADSTPDFGSETVEDKVYTAGAAITETLPAATGGNSPVTYSITPALPSGLNFDSNTREISGTPADVTPETDHTYTVTDKEGDTAELTFSITVETDSNPHFSDQSISNKTYGVGSPILPVTLPAASGGNAPLRYRISGGGLPSGLRFNSTTRVLSGTPRRQIINTYSYIVTDADGDTRTLYFTITVKSAHSFPSFGSQTVTDKEYITGTAVTETLPSATGGNGTLTYGLTPALPAGLSFDNNTRTISGTPTSALSTRAYTYSVRDVDGDTHRLRFNVTVTRPEPDTSPTFGSETIDDQRYLTGETVSLTLPEATSGNAPLTYSINNAFLGDSLFRDLSFDSNTRTITGTLDPTIDPSNFGNPFRELYT